MSLSVLMSVYANDRPDYLQLAMESIWDEQTLKPNEIILVEDGKLSMDLHKILNSWQEKIGSVLKRIPLKENQGLTKALNVGINYCSCEFIARMDADDMSSPNRFQIQINIMKSHPEVSVVGGAIQEFNERNQKICIRTYPRNTIAALKYIYKASPLAHATVLFRKSLFDNGIRYNEHFKISQDIELWFRLLKQNYKIYNVPDVIYYVRVSKDFYSRRSKKKAINEFKIYWRGILSLYNISWKLIYPVLRLCFRLLPNSIIQKIYTGRLRKSINNE